MKRLLYIPLAFYALLLACALSDDPFTYLIYSRPVERVYEFFGGVR